jgi:UDP:flavonoid glycosyltransferase YjiC (YdhE family)
MSHLDLSDDMKIIMSSTPQHGHLLPLLPLARAFRDRGNEVAVLTSGGMRSVIQSEGFRLLPVGPLPDAMLAEVRARTGLDPAGNPTPESVAEFFAGVRVELTAEEALAAAREFRPDLVVRELCDYIGPLVAADRNVPMATLAYGPARPRAFITALDATAKSRYAAWGLSAQPSTWHLDTCPPSLQADGWERPEGWQLLRPEPHHSAGTAAAALELSARRRVLVTFGTFFNAPEVVSPLLRQLSALDADIVATLGLRTDPRQFDVDHSRVTFVPFTPLANLLQGVDAVLTHGGAGTTLAALSKGIPLVVTPQGADQFVQAERVAAVGAGIALQPGAATPEAVTAAVRTAMSELSYREAAAAVAKDIASMPEPSRVAAVLEGAGDGHG